MKTLLIWALAGALLGIVIASVVVPPALSWYSAPGGLPEGTQIQALVQIPEVIRYATGKLIRGQMIGAALGALGGAIWGFLATRKSAVGSDTARKSTA
jgi:hypothetical protein